MEQVMGISEFKVHALKILDEIAKSQGTVVITKRGKPLVRIIPYRSTETAPEPGRLAHHLAFETDIVSPLGENMWEAAE